MASWIPVPPKSHFPIQNIPFGVFSVGSNAPHCATIIGETVIDLSVIYDAGLLNNLGLNSNVFAEPSLNSFMAHTKPVWSGVRARLIELFKEGGDESVKNNQELQKNALFNANEVQLHLPVNITDYTDFYSSREHATNVGIMFRGKDNALQPNWLHLPVGYHGRASTVVISGTEVRRPVGQVQKDKANPSEGSIFSPCRLLDFELEMGAFIGGPANEMGTPISMEEAEDRIFGVVLLNDWSARDIQAWEYVPLGPFTAKNFATTISPWIVSLEALEPFRCESSAGPVQDNPQPLPYLIDPNYAKGTYNVNLEVSIKPETESEYSNISVSNFKYLYWNMKQQLVHHSVTGCSMRPGDLLGSGTISGPVETSFGSLLELSWRGEKQVALVNSKEDKVRKFLADGDSVNITGYAQNGDVIIGFGNCEGKILPAKSNFL